ncbi:hypothetical protein LUZ60_014119 [Juncus effusus]|nr:hypothetical protein LUZ60_014119 [Juncus effusus]
MNGGGGRGSPDAAYGEAKTSVWWDIENCMVPRGTDPNPIAQNISTALACAGFTGPISISAYGDTGQLSSTIQHALSSTGISLHHVPAGIKDASDKKILVDMLFWAIDNPPPANILLISGDRDFCNALHKLRMRRYNILLAHAPSVSQTLIAAAKTVWHWKSLVVGEPPLSEPSYVSSFAKEVKDDDVAASETVQSAPPSLETLGLNDQKSGLGGTSSNSYPFAPQTQTAMPAPQSNPHSCVPSNCHANPYEPQPNMQPNMHSYNPTNSYNNSYVPHNPIPSAQNFGPPPPNNHNMHYGTANPNWPGGTPYTTPAPSRNFSSEPTYYPPNPNWPGGSPYPTPAPSGNFSREPTYYPPNPNHPYPPQNYHDCHYRPVQHVPPPVPVPPARKTAGTSTGGTVPNQPKPEVEILISVVLRALSILKKEKITSNKVNISDCIHFGEINMPLFNAKSALKAALQHNAVVQHLERKGSNNNTLYVPKNEKMWNCVNVMDIDVKISKKTKNELTRFLSSSEGRNELMASQGRYHAAIILKKSCLKTRTLGDVLQILNNLISVNKWIIPHSSSGWQPLSFNLNGSDLNLDSKPVNNQPSSVNNQATSSNSTGLDD